MNDADMFAAVVIIGVILIIAVAGFCSYYIAPHGEFNTILTVTDKNVMHNEEGYPVYTVTFASDDHTFVYQGTNSINVYNAVEVGKTYVCTYNDYKIVGHTIDSTNHIYGSKMSVDPIVKINGVSMGD